MLAQRDYIELFHIAVKALRQDYAGKVDKAKLDLPNPHTNRMAKAIITGLGFDSTFVETMNAYLAGFKDKQLSLNIDSTQCHFTPFSCGFYARRCSEGLFVTLCTQAQNMKVGDQILRLSEFSVPMLTKMYGASLYGEIPERELWSGLLQMYKTYLVRHKDGSEEIIEQEKFQTPEKWTNRFKHIDPDTAYLRLEDFSDPQNMQKILNKHRAEIQSCKKLILDLRRTRGIDENAAIALIPYLFHSPVCLAKILGSQRVQTLFSHQNCTLLKNRLIQMLPAADAEEAVWIQELIENLDLKTGSGFQDDPEEIPAEWEEPLPSLRTRYEVFLLTDTYCRGIAETIAARCSKTSSAVLVGRPSMGDLGYCHPVTIPLDNAFSLTYPISRTADADRYAAKGVPVDIYIPWSVEELEKDILLQKALDS